MAIKLWFLQKNHLYWMYGKELEPVKETEKALLLAVTINGERYEEWIPKSCIIDAWEKDTTGFGYHSYLEDVYHKAYAAGQIHNRIIKSGRNRYAGDAFVHQWTSKEIAASLDKYNISYMNRTEWNNR